MPFEQVQKSEVSGIADEEILTAIYDEGLPPEELADYMAWNSYDYGEGQSRSQDAGRITCGSGSTTWIMGPLSTASTPTIVSCPVISSGSRS
ncbi:hypothetical protein [Streptosporangium canum]|uniref:hypothetical protein n=1 Tax=Streptosporangium canum TaxID=324952 RepID=UPI0037996253